MTYLKIDVWEKCKVTPSSAKLKKYIFLCAAALNCINPQNNWMLVSEPFHLQHLMEMTWLESWIDRDARPVNAKNCTLFCLFDFTAAVKVKYAKLMLQVTGLQACKETWLWVSCFSQCGINDPSKSCGLWKQSACFRGLNMMFSKWKTPLLLFISHFL